MDSLLNDLRFIDCFQIELKTEILLNDLRFMD